MEATAPAHASEVPPESGRYKASLLRNRENSESFDKLMAMECILGAQWATVENLAGPEFGDAVIIEDVDADGSLVRAPIVPGDMIIAVGIGERYRLEKAGDMLDVLARYLPGDTVPMLVLRGLDMRMEVVYVELFPRCNEQHHDWEQDLVVEDRQRCVRGLRRDCGLDRHPDVRRNSFLVSLQEAIHRLQDMGPPSCGLDVESSAARNGLLVSSVRMNSTALRARPQLMTGDVICQVGRREVRTVQEFDSELADCLPGDVVVLTVYRKTGDRVFRTRIELESEMARAEEVRGLRYIAGLAVWNPLQG